MARSKAPAPPLENTIEPAALRLQQQQVPDARKARDERATENGIQAERAAADAADRAKRSPGAPTASADAAPRDTTSVPEGVRDRFLQVKEKFYFPNGDPAFRDLGVKLTTKSENAEIVRSLVEIAQARGWDEINVGGTKDFKRAVWHEASLQKIAVRGYMPTEIDEARLVQAMARRRDAVREAASAPPPPSGAPDTNMPRREEQRREDRGRDDRDAPDEQSSGKKRVFFGTLVAHGPENFNFNPNEDISYYVKLKADSGREKILWGKDLQRAIRESKSQPKVGDRIGVSHAGQESVTVPKKERDGEGRVLREYELKTHRNEWTVESDSFFRERAKLAEIVRDGSIDAKRAIDHSPSLAGTYVTLKGAELFAKKNFEDPHQQGRFVETIRRTLAREIKSGAPLYAPAMRDRVGAAERTAARSPAAPEMSPLR